MKKVRILSLDGGGIRGIIPATILKYVEEYLQQKAPGTTIADHFDFIAGTSTGGILTCIYLAPQEGNKSKARFTATEALDFYVKEGYNIFNASKISNWKRLWGILNATKYSPKCIEDLFKTKFGDIFIDELMKPCLITTYDMVNKAAVFFTSLDNTKRKKFYVRDVTRSTSAAPTYFPPAQINNYAIDAEVTDMINLDGGVFANNPLMCAYAEVRKLDFETRENKHPTIDSMYILSLGTGGGGFKLSNKEKSATWGLVKWAKSIPDIMMDGSINTVHYQMNEICKTIPEHALGDYMRVDVPQYARDYAPDMSDASPGNIKKLQEAGEKTLEFAKINGLNKFLDGLLD